MQRECTDPSAGKQDQGRRIRTLTTRTLLSSSQFDRLSLFCALAAAGPDLTHPGRSDVLASMTARFLLRFPFCMRRRKALFQLLHVSPLRTLSSTLLFCLPATRQHSSTTEQPMGRRRHLLFLCSGGVPIDVQGWARLQFRLFEIVSRLS